MPHVNDGPARLDWTVTKGADVARAFTITQGGGAYSLVGATVTAVVKTERDSSGAAATGATLAATLTNAAGGVLTLTPSTTSATAGRYWWSLQITTSGGADVPLLYGQFTITDEVAV